MLQRIQSVYLAISAVMVAIFFFIPISDVQVGSELYVIKASGVYYQDVEGLIFETPLLALGAVLFFTFILLLASIFQYKNRKMQIKLCTLNLVLLLISLGLVFLRSGDIPADLAVEGEKTITYSYGGLFLILPIILTFLAQRAIKKDDALVKSLDRLR